MRHRSLSLLGSLVVLLAVICWTIVDSSRAEAADPPAVAETVSPRSAALATETTSPQAAAPVVETTSPLNAAPVAETVSPRYAAAVPLNNYTFVPPPSSNGQPVRLLVVLHGMGGSGADMAAIFGPLAAERGWALLAPTMPYRDYFDPEQVRRDGELLPRLRALIDVISARPGVALQPGVVMFGFSRGSQEAIRFSLMFPDYTLGVAGLSAGSYTLPTSTYGDGRAMRYPFGTSDVDTFCGKKFDAAATRQVAYWIGVGGSDTNAQEVPRQWDPLVGTNRVDRAKRYVEILQQFGARASLQVFPGAGHEVTAAMRDEALKFLASVAS